MPEKKLTFHQLATNPAGKGSAQIANRGKTIIDLKKRVSTNEKVHGITMDVYKVEDTFVLYFKILSESWEDLWYDTVIRLTPPKELDISKERTVGQYEVEMISNMPSFAFIYFYALNKKGWLIKEFEDKFPEIFFKEAPKVRNPKMDMGFEKSILFCAFFMTEKRYQYIETLNKLSKGKPNYLILKKKFLSFEKKMKEYNEKKKATKKKQKAAINLHFKSNRKEKIKPKESKKSESSKRSISSKHSNAHSKKLYSSRNE